MSKVPIISGYDDIAEMLLKVALKHQKSINLMVNNSPNINEENKYLSPCYC
jgi:hypothetical protein